MMTNEEIQEIEAAIAGRDSEATRASITIYCFRRQDEIVRAEVVLAAAKKKYRDWLLKEALQRGGELAVSDYQATVTDGRLEITRITT